MCTTPDALLFLVVLIGVALRGCVVAWATINSSFKMLADALTMIPSLPVVALTVFLECGCAVA